MSRLVTFGCSFTFGSELEYPNTESWPAVLGNLTNRTVVNNGNPGSSNLEILSSILSYKFRLDDLVVIGWTYCDRDIIFNKITANKKINHWQDKDLFEKWAEIHSNHDSNIRSSMYIHHASLYLNSLNLKNYSFWAPPTPGLHRFIDTILGNRPKGIGKNILYTNILNTEDLATDQSHPGPVAHKIAAEKLYRIIDAE
jgi:hypothetical protein